MYKLFTSPIGHNFILKMENNSYVPFDPDNTDYQQYLAWLEAGNTPLPADEPNT